MGRHEWTLYDSVSPSLNLPFSDGYIRARKPALTKARNLPILNGFGIVEEVHHAGCH